MAILPTTGSGPRKQERRRGVFSRVAPTNGAALETPTNGGKSPAERLMGFQPRSRLSGYFPGEEEEQENDKIIEQTSSTRLSLTPGMRVWSRQFQPGQRRLPGTVISTDGRRMVTLDTPGGQQRRHPDQLRRRDTTHAPQEAEVKVETGEQEEQSTSEDRATSSDGADYEHGDFGPVEPATQPALPRRSTRKRKPPDRLNL
ncbi:hypothetical protein HPB47_014496 [Ixodes persulcatus]|uniref:Uncharacterized protein n=1 Tax=Ixodes persulcatus TaxID=34615 RepID=A0AC60QYB5_IXOPE|nr:hypothetical protein HPB47_014496 [Ixodes persulcatus]